MKDSESIKEFHLSITTIIHQPKILGEDLMEQKVIEKILRSLDSKFNLIVRVIKKVRELNKLTVNQLTGSSGFFINS